MYLDHETDQQRQQLAEELLAQVPNKTIRQWLDDQIDQEFKNDMKIRLNKLRKQVRIQHGN